MSFDHDDLALIDRTVEVTIETQAPDAPPHRAVIWAVVDDDRVFIRSWRGETARWYREALENPAVTLHVGDRSLSATAIPADDPDSIERASDGLRRKYRGDPATESMVRPEIFGTTLRLEPA
jgi:hypothetical protein